MKSIFLTAVCILCFACGNNAQNKPATKPEIANAKPVEVPLENGMAKAYFASGCFWCVEAHRSYEISPCQLSRGTIS